jgi:hypothetical protein
VCQTTTLAAFARIIACILSHEDGKC